MNLRDQPNGKPLVFLWENLGPSHHDRLRAIADAGYDVTAVELFANSDVYDWEQYAPGPGFKVVSLAENRQAVSIMELARLIFEASCDAHAVFLCHYNEIAVFLAARKLRASSVPVFTMLDSKADDRPRSRLLDWPKRAMLSPYDGALVAGERSARYASSLGIPPNRIASHYNTLDIAALRDLAPQGIVPDFTDRPFLVVARLIPEKNLGAALEAFARYHHGGGQRRMSIVGSGPEGSRLRALAERLGLAEVVDWHGSLSRAEVAKAMRSAIALLLPSTSETYGLVVIEALAQGLPVIVSRKAGVVDLPIWNGEEGIVIEPNDIAEICNAMQSLDSDEGEWQRRSGLARSAAELADTRYFVVSVKQLAGLERG